MSARLSPAFGLVVLVAVAGCGGVGVSARPRVTQAYHSQRSQAVSPVVSVQPAAGRVGTLVKLTVRNCPEDVLREGRHRYPTAFFHDSANLVAGPTETLSSLGFPRRVEHGSLALLSFRIGRNDSLGAGQFVIFCETGTARARFFVRPPVATRPCAPSAMTVSAAYQGAAGGAARADIVFHNVSTRSCTLWGYPQVVFLTSNGARLRLPASPGGSMVTVDHGAQLVYLPPSGTASASLGYDDNPPMRRTTCPQVSRLLVSPPHRRRWFTVRVNLVRSGDPHGLYVCTPPSVTALVAGAQGSGLPP